MDRNGESLVKNGFHFGARGLGLKGKLVSNIMRRIWRLNVPWNGLCTGAEWLGSWCEAAEAPLFVPKAIWGTADPRLQGDPWGFEQTAPDTPWVCQAWALSEEEDPWAARHLGGQPMQSKTSPARGRGGRAKWPWKLCVWAKLLSNYIALQTRQNCVSWKACMQSQAKSSKGRPGGNWSKGSCYRVHCHPGRKSRKEVGEAVCHSAECYMHVVNNETHLNGIGDSERKCAISLRISHHSLWNLI